MLLAVALVVSCTPQAVVRGDTVTCAARLEPAGPMIVTELRADADGHVLRDPSEKHAAGEFLWRGLAVVDTKVTVSVRTPGGQALRGAASFSVTPRALDRLHVPEARPAWEYGDDKLFGGWPPRMGALSSPADPIAADGALGVLTISLPTPRTRYVDEGPNARWFFVSEPVQQPAIRIYVSRALKPGDPFYELQQGGPRIGLRAGCDKADMDHLRDGILEHEGALPSERPSHFGETRKAFANRDLQGEVEGLRLFYDEAVKGDPLQKLVEKKLQNFLDAIRLEQQDTVDVAAKVHVKCRLQYP